MAPSQPTRLMTCTLKRWKWMACVSTPLWVIFQICVPSPATTGPGVTESVMISVAGSR